MKKKNLLLLITLLISSRMVTTQRLSFTNQNKNAKISIKRDYSKNYLIKSWAQSSLEIAHCFDSPDINSFLTLVQPKNPEKNFEILTCSEDKKCDGTRTYAITDDSGTEFRIENYSFSPENGFKLLKFSYIEDVDRRIKIPSNGKILYFKESNDKNKLHLLISSQNGASNIFDFYFSEINKNDLTQTITVLKDFQIKDFDEGKDKLIGEYFEYEKGYALVYKKDKNSKDRVDRKEDSRKQERVYIVRFGDLKGVEFELKEFSSTGKEVLFIESATLFKTEGGDLSIAFTEFFENISGLTQVKISNFEEGKVEKIKQDKKENALRVVFWNEVKPDSFSIFTFDYDSEKKQSSITYGSSEPFNTGDVDLRNQFEISSKFVQILTLKSKMEISTQLSKTGEKDTLSLPIYTKINSELIASISSTKFILNENGILKFIDLPVSSFDLYVDTNLEENQNPEFQIEFYSSPEKTEKNEIFKYYVYNENNFLLNVKKQKIQIVEGGVISPESAYEKIINTNYASITDPYSVEDKPKKLKKINQKVKLKELNNITGAKNNFYLKKFLLDQEKMIAIEEKSVKFYKGKSLNFQSGFSYPIKKILDFKITKTYLVILYKTEGGRLSVVEVDLFAQNLVNNVYFEFSSEIAKIDLVMKENSGISVDVEYVKIYLFDQKKNNLNIYQRKVITTGNFILGQTVENIVQKTPLTLPELESLEISRFDFVEIDSKNHKILMIFKYYQMKKVFAYTVEISDKLSLSNPKSTTLASFEDSKDVGSFQSLLSKSTLIFGPKDLYKAQTINILTLTTRNLIDFTDFDYKFDSCKPNLQKNLIFCYNKGFEFLVINNPKSVPFNRLSFFRFANPYKVGAAPEKAAMSFNRVQNFVHFIADFGSVKEDSKLDSSYFGSVSLDGYTLGVGFDSEKKNNVKFTMFPKIPIEMEINRVKNSLAPKIEYKKEIKKMEVESKNILDLKNIEGLSGSFIKAYYSGDDFKVRGGVSLNFNSSKVGFPIEEKYHTMLALESSEISRSEKFVPVYIIGVISGIEKFFYFGFFDENNKENLKKINGVKCGENDDYVFGKVKGLEEKVDFMVICGRKLFIGQIGNGGSQEVKSVLLSDDVDLENFGQDDVDVQYYRDDYSFFSFYDFKERSFKVYFVDFEHRKVKEIQIESSPEGINYIFFLIYFLELKTCNMVDGKKAIFSGFSEDNKEIYFRILDMERATMKGGKILIDQADERAKKLGPLKKSICQNSENKIICHSIGYGSYLHSFEIGKITKIPISKFSL